MQKWTPLNPKLFMNTWPKPKLHINDEALYVSVSHTPIALPGTVSVTGFRNTIRLWNSTSSPAPPSVLTRPCACYHQTPIKGHELTVNRWAPYWSDRKKVVISTQAYHLQNISDGHKLFSYLPKIVRSSWTDTKPWKTPSLQMRVLRDGADKDILNDLNTNDRLFTVGMTRLLEMTWKLRAPFTEGKFIG